MRLKRNIEVGIWRRVLIFLLLVYAFPVKAQDQKTTPAGVSNSSLTPYPTPDLYKLSEDSLKPDMRDVYCIWDEMNQFGESAEFDFFSDFLDLTPAQKEKYLSFNKQMDDLFSKRNLESRVADHLGKQRDDTEEPGLEENEHREASDRLDVQIVSTYRSGLKDILGNKKFRRYLCYLNWKGCFDVAEWDVNKMSRCGNWAPINEMDDNRLKESGISDSTKRESLLNILYEDYFDYHESSRRIYLNMSVSFVQDAISALHEYEKRREDRKNKVKGLLNDKINNENIADQFGLILDNLILLRTSQPFSTGYLSHYTPVPSKKIIPSQSQGFTFSPDSKIGDEMVRQEKRIFEDKKNGLLTADQAKALMGNLGKVQTEMRDTALSKHEHYFTPDETSKFLQELQIYAPKIP